MRPGKVGCFVAAVDSLPPDTSRLTEKPHGKLIYWTTAATFFPKPEEVYRYMDEFYRTPE
jgi:hypothetical protein